MFLKYNLGAIYKSRDKVNKLEMRLSSTPKAAIMSVFKVKLNNTAQGLLDKRFDSGVEGDHGSQFATSIQRTIYVTGPGKTYRKLADGETFTDCNYWKRFAYPQVPLDQAFIEVVTDDGSAYHDGDVETTFPKVYNMLVLQGTDYEDNVVDILGDTGGYAVFVQIANQGSTAVRCRINGVADAVIDIGASETQVFNSGDLSVSKLEFVNNVSGGTAADVQVLLSVKSVCNS